MTKKAFTGLTVAAAASAAVAYIFNFPEMVDGQGKTLPIVFSAVFMLISAVYPFACKSKKGALTAGVVYWALCAVAAACVAVAVLADIESSFILISAFLLGGYFAVPALLGAPGAAYLAALAAIPAAFLIYNIVLLCKAKKA